MLSCSELHIFTVTLLKDVLGCWGCLPNYSCSYIVTEEKEGGSGRVGENVQLRGCSEWMDYELFQLTEISSEIRMTCNCCCCCMAVKRARPEMEGEATLLGTTMGAEEATSNPPPPPPPHLP